MVQVIIIIIKIVIVIIKHDISLYAPFNGETIVTAKAFSLSTVVGKQGDITIGKNFEKVEQTCFFTKLRNLFQLNALRTETRTYFSLSTFADNCTISQSHF